MSVPRFIQIHTLHSYPAALLNRDDAGLAKRMPFGGVERTRVSSQCLKRHWRMANDPFALRTISPDIGVSVRSRRVWSVKVADALVAEGIDRKAVEAVLKAMQDDLYGQSKKAQANAKDAEIDLDRSELVVLGFKEIEYLKQETKRIVALTGADAKKIAVELKDLRKNLHALIAGAGIDAAMFGRFVSGDREARVDAAVHVAHAFTVHAQASEPDYFTAVDDLQAEEQGSGAGHLNTTELTSGVYYGYVVVDVPSLVANLEGCNAKRWLDADRALAAKTVEHLLHLIAKVTPGAKLGSTAPYDWASLVLVEAGDEQPRTLANAFLEPIKRAPQDQYAADALARHVAGIDGMYDSTVIRWLATRLNAVEIANATTCAFPKLVAATAAAIRADA